MKILPVEKIREADAYTIKHEPIASIDLMERAAGQLFKWISKRVDTSHTVRTFAGPGNNGGDGLAVSRMLHQKGYDVHVYLINYAKNRSEDAAINLKRLEELKKVPIIPVDDKNDLPEIGEDDIIIDAIFGSGLTRPVTGFFGEVIKHLNAADAVSLSIDIPSGLFADQHVDPEEGAVIRADYTLSFQMPKLAFLLPENDPFVGEWHILDIGLHHDYINSVEVKNFLLEKRDVRTTLRPRNKFAHKGTFGHALLIAGSYGKMGAAILASRACLRSGVGLLHTHIPKAGYEIMQTAVPECMLSIDRYDNYFSEVPDLSMYTAVGIGPGLGMEQQSQMALKLLIQNYANPIVLDADALNILAENKTWLAFLPKGSILTPHPKEFERLAGKWSDDYEKLQKLRDLCFKYNIYIVLKGAHTCTGTPDRKCYFNSTGNPGMATAGSGDVLTGLITGLLAQGYSPAQAATLGVYLHGLAGDLAAKKKGQEAMIAGDMTDMLGEAFRKLR